MDDIYPSIDMRDLIPGNPYFRWGESLLLREWNIYVHPTIDQAQSIIKVAKTMCDIRGRLGSKPLLVTSWLRTPQYNAQIGGAPGSKHLLGLACDFKHPSMTCDEVRAELLPELDRMGIRMENNPGSGWVHIDLASLVLAGERYFKP